MKQVFLRIKDVEGVQHMIRPGTIMRVCDSKPPNDPSVVHIYTTEARIRVAGKLDDVFQALEPYL